MRTLIVSCSPKRRLSASGLLACVQRLSVRGTVRRLALRRRGDLPAVLEHLCQADAVILSMPLYVDGVPSHVLEFLREAETFCKENDLHPRLYCIANNGFIEGRQSEPLMRTLENFCARSGLDWCGGVGVGGGVMLNVNAVLMCLKLALLPVSLLLNRLLPDGSTPLDVLADTAINLLVLLALCSTILFFLVRQGRAVSAGADAGTHYTRVLIPSFIFIPMANVFFVIVSLFQGGLFRGWLAPKEIGQPNPEA
ncbi:hypothetical protein [Olsenella sp. HMSC062G07]|uniref:hypothetical protein n=1 Tax=Olsenella sp. HMSC062G07 TaxID=1739330 RepID=UPI0008A602BE|nr:hypothetical protein [Olsenella sp. HMSC062G07]OFK22821.1 hypothetical protein HMPREF2826_00880 [Olsenella sp. HMSC062G07]